MKKLSNILWGIIFVGIGIILALNSLEITNINIFFDGWWTLFIIIPSCLGLINDNDKVGNIFGIAIGLSLLLVCQDLINLELLLKLAFPAILIFIGLSLIFKDKSNEIIKKEVKELSSKKKNNKEYCSTFSSVNIKLDDESVEKYELNAIFGELNGDLTEGEIKKDLLINACAIFGSITLTVPDDVEVKIVSTPVFGGVRDSRKKKNKDKKNTIYLNATAIFGGVEIK